MTDFGFWWCITCLISGQFLFSARNFLCSCSTKLEEGEKKHFLTFLVTGNGRLKKTFFLNTEVTSFGNLADLLQS